MSLPRHHLSSDTFAALAAGGGGAAAARQLAAAQHSKHVLLVWGVMDASRAAGHPQAGHACRGYELLAEIQRRAPDAVEAVLRHPAVGGWAERTLRALDASGPASARTGPDRPARDHLFRGGGGPGRLGSGDSRTGNEPARLALGATVPRGSRRSWPPWRRRPPSGPGTPAPSRCRCAAARSRCRPWDRRCSRQDGPRRGWPTCGARPTGRG